METNKSTVAYALKKRYLPHGSIYFVSFYKNEADAMFDCSQKNKECKKWKKTFICFVEPIEIQYSRAMLPSEED